MAKKKQKKTSASNQSAKKSAVDAPKISLSRRNVLRSAGAVGVALAGGTWLHLADKRDRALHDLSAIGAGKPLVVQVHDPSCPMCRQLKRSTETALESMPEVDYRIADLTTRKGKALANQYGEGKVTLLLFNPKGKHLGTVRGVTPVEELRETFERQFRL